MSDPGRRVTQLLDRLPDHWSVMRVSKLGGREWRVYDNTGYLVEADEDLELALMKALGDE